MFFQLQHSTRQFLLVRWVVLLLSLVASAIVDAQTAPVKGSSLYEEAMHFLIEGRVDEAKKTLMQLTAQEPEDAGAWLDLAILNCGLGNAQEAEKIFSGIEARFAPPDAIRELIAQQRAGKCQATRSPLVQLRFRVGRGLDNNANLGASHSSFSLGNDVSAITLDMAPEHLPKKSEFTNISAEVMVPVPSAGVQVFGLAQSRRYDNLPDFNQVSLVGGLEQLWRWQEWELQNTVQFGIMMLDNRRYQNNFQWQFQAIPPLLLPKPWQLGLQGGYMRVSYPSLRSFDSNLWESRAAITYKTQDFLANVGAGFSFDNANGDRPGGDRSGWGVTLAGKVRLWDEVFGEFSWISQDWKGNAIYSPGVINKRRHQLVHSFRTGVFFPVSEGYGVQLEYKNIRNKENISLFEYKGQQIQLNWQWQPRFF